MDINRLVNSIDRLAKSQEESNKLFTESIKTHQESLEFQRQVQAENQAIANESKQDNQKIIQQNDTMAEIVTKNLNRYQDTLNNLVENQNAMAETLHELTQIYNESLVEEIQEQK